LVPVFRPRRLHASFVTIAVIAAIAPGRRAARLHVVNALQYE
jgi:ABC-type lipoprotein release transport system permease subunit